MNKWLSYMNMKNFMSMWPCILTNFLLIKPTDALISQIYLSRNSTCFRQFLCPSSGVFHRTCGIGIWHVGSMTHTSAKCTVENSWWWAEELPETCRVSWQNKFGKLVRLLVLLKRKTNMKISWFRWWFWLNSIHNAWNEQHECGKCSTSNN